MRQGHGFIGFGLGLIASALFFACLLKDPLLPTCSIGLFFVGLIIAGLGIILNLHDEWNRVDDFELNEPETIASGGIDPDGPIEEVSAEELIDIDTDVGIDEEQFSDKTDPQPLIKRDED